MVNRTLLWLIALGLVAGCAGGGPPRDINDPGNGFVFGYVDMSEAPTPAASAQLLQVSPPSDAPYWGTGVRDGLFFHYLPPGSYQLSSLRGSTLLRGEHRYGFPRQSKDATVRVDKPGNLHFLGAYKYKDVKSGLFEQGKFDLERAARPTEAELLRLLLEKEPSIKGSIWEEKIRQRLVRLK